MINLSSDRNSDQHVLGFLQGDVLSRYTPDGLPTPVEGDRGHGDFLEPIDKG